MLEAVPDVGVGLQVEDPVAALERRSQQRRVEHVALDSVTPGAAVSASMNSPPPGAEVVDDDDLDAIGTQAVGEVRADEAGAAGDASAFHLRFRA